MLISTLTHGRHSLSDEDLKDFPRLGSLDDYAFLLRRHGFAAFLDLLESTDQELLRPPA